MKQSLYVLFLLILLLVAFWGGARYHQRVAASDTGDARNRQILHYVDPMNPEHISQEPGIAPCGMPMEPVYADDSQGSPKATGAVAQGGVRLNLQKQQTIGVQIAEVTRTAATMRIRALGRIVPDENRVYPLIAATDGWMETIQAGTTGSLVSQQQLLAQIRVTNYDFFTWQQRLLTELGYTNRLGGGAPSTLRATDQSRRRSTSGAGYEAGLPIPESESRFIRRSATMARMAAENNSSQSMEEPAADDAGMDRAPETAPEQDGEAHAGHPGHAAPMRGDDMASGSREQNILLSSQGRQELLNLGVTEQQLQAFAESGDYITHVELRSPVEGFVLARKVASLQRIDRGVECFTIADLSRVWVEADVFGDEAMHLQPGTEARVTLPDQNEPSFAIVGETLPRFDAATRALRVRLELDNPGNLFRPEMFVDVDFLVPMAETNTVPAGAVIDTGRRKTVYVVAEEGLFEPREVLTGWSADDRIEIIEGLKVGEKVVAAGAFLIDSESRMRRAAAKLMEEKTTAPEKAASSQTAPENQAMPQAGPAAIPSAPSTTAKPSVAPATALAPDKAVKDPVCGMTVDPGSAKADGLTAEVDGILSFFCSEDCREQFKQNPTQFLDNQAGQHRPMPALEHGGHPHD